METKAKIREFIQKELVNDKAYENLSDSESLIDSGIIDSLGIMKLIGFLEDNLSIQISDEELIPENFATVDAIHTLVAQKTA